MAAKQDAPWMPPPQTPMGCPPGLEYLTKIDQILVQQQVELLEGLYVDDAGPSRHQYYIRFLSLTQY